MRSHIISNCPLGHPNTSAIARFDSPSAASSVSMLIRSTRSRNLQPDPIRPFAPREATRFRRTELDSQRELAEPALADLFERLRKFFRIPSFKFKVILSVAFARCVSWAIPKAVILARLVGRHSTIRRIASRHYSAEGLLRMCRRLQRAI
jgi:hypothetical protein